MAGALQTVRIDNLDGYITAHHDRAARTVGYDICIFDLHLAFGIGLDKRLVNHLRRTTNVERPHGQLRARLTDRLGRDHADRLAHIDRRSAGKVAPVTRRADTVFRFACQRRANFDAHQIGFFNRAQMFFRNQLTSFDDNLVIGRIDHIGNRHTTQHTVAERGNHLTGVDHGGDGNACRGAAIDLIDDAILRHIDETPR